MAQRRNSTLRDMTISMVAILIGVLAIVGLYGGFSFEPGGPSAGQRPTADVAGGFSRADRVVGFAPVQPKGVPADWHPNSFSQQTAAQAPAKAGTVRGGWLTPGEKFITLIQSKASVNDLLQAELDMVSPAAGTVTVGGAEWSVTAGRRQEVAWYRTSGEITLLITGSASEQAFRTLAEAVAGS